MRCRALRAALRKAAFPIASGAAPERRRGHALAGSSMERDSSSSRRGARATREARISSYDRHSLTEESLLERVARDQPVPQDWRDWFAPRRKVGRAVRREPAAAHPFSVVALRGDEIRARDAGALAADVELELELVTRPRLQLL